MENKNSNGKRYWIGLDDITFVNPHVSRKKIEGFVSNIRNGKTNLLEGVFIKDPSTLQWTFLVSPECQPEVFALQKCKRKTVEVIDIMNAERKKRLSEEYKALQVQIQNLGPLHISDYTPDVSEKYIY